MTATSPIRTRLRASSPSLAPMSMCRSRSSGTFLRSSSRSRWIALRPATPGRMPSRVSSVDALADEDLRIPAADAHEAQEAVVVDVRDDQADLVDVPDDASDGTPPDVGCPGHAGDRRAHDVDGDVVGEGARGLAEHGGGSRLVARGPGGGEQLAKDVGKGHAARVLDASRARFSRARAGAHYSAPVRSALQSPPGRLRGRARGARGGRLRPDRRSTSRRPRGSSTRRSRRRSGRGVRSVVCPNEGQGQGAARRSAAS